MAVAVGSGTSPYRGEDRRRSLPTPTGGTSGLLLGGTLLFVAWSAVTVLDGLPVLRDNVDMTLLRALLQAGSAALAVVVALLFFVRWWLGGEAAGLWAGLAMFGFGTVTVGITDLVPLVYRGLDTVGLAWASPASRIVAMVLLAVGVASHEVDGRQRLAWIAGLATGATVLLTALLAVAPNVGQHLAGSGDVHRLMPVSPLEGLFVVLAWAALAAGFFIRGARRDRPLLSWLGLIMSGFALAELIRLLAAEGTALWSMGAQLLQLTALVIGLIGLTVELLRQFGHLADDLLASKVDTAAAEARLAAGLQENEERAHEARNALQAIEGATQTLERHRDQLDEQSREALARAVNREIARMQGLVSAAAVSKDLATFDVAETLAPAITGARSLGAGVLVDIAEGLQAYGRWSDTVQVVQNLVENARRYAPESPVAVRARGIGDRVEIRVEDRGPGVPADQREAIFRRGVRGPTTNGQDGSGLGLYVSARLMRLQAGSLSLEDRPGGGAVFVVTLPAAPEAGGDKPADVDAAGG